jgi:hypothetical protein
MCTDDLTYVGVVESTFFNIPFIPDGVAGGALPTSVPASKLKL